MASTIHFGLRPRPDQVFAGWLDPRIGRYGRSLLFAFGVVQALVQRKPFGLRQGF
jgi:hypothetical protein